MSYRLNTPFKERRLQFCTFKTKHWPILLLLLFISKKWENVLFLKDYNVTYVYHGDARLCYLIKFTEIDNKKPKMSSSFQKQGDCFYFREITKYSWLYQCNFIYHKIYWIKFLTAFLAGMQLPISQHAYIKYITA